MDQELWSTVDNWLAGHLVGSDDALRHALSESDRAGLSAINVSPSMGKLLHLLARLRGARNILEIGTLGGYSSIWMAQALPSDGRLITLEINPDTAAVARSNIAYAGLDNIIEVRVGRALDSLPRIAEEQLPPFDLVFVDADKKSNPDYLEWALKLTQPGSVIVIDNIVRQGRVADASDDDPDIQGVRRVVEMISADPRVTATAIQTVGIKRYDGFLIALVQSV